MKIPVGKKKSHRTPARSRLSFDIKPKVSSDTLISLRPKERSPYGLVRDDLLRVVRRRKRELFILGFILASTVFFTMFHPLIHATTTTLYPQSCLGGWDHVHNAEGTPQLPLGADPADFNDTNSAVLSKDVRAEIFCGGFQGTIPPASKPRKVFLSLFWSAQNTVAKTIQSQDFASSTGAILDATGTAPTFDLTSSTASTTQAPPPPLPASIPKPTAPDTMPVPPSVPEPAPVPKDVTSPSAAPVAPPTDPPAAPITAPPSEPPAPTVTSLFESFTAVAHAETVGDIHITDTLSSTSATTTDMASSTPSSTPPPARAGDFVEVRYTLDGTTWNSLGTFDEAHIGESTFEIPLTDTSEWQDLSKLQVSIRSVTTLDSKPALYVDGMKLVVEYTGEKETKIDPAIDLATAPLVVSSPVQVSGPLVLNLMTNEDGKPALDFTSPGGGELFLYRGSKETPVLTSGLGDQVLEIPAYFFYPDSYTAILVESSSACIPKPNRIACENKTGFKGEWTFAISVASSTDGILPTTPVVATTTILSTSTASASL